AAVSVAAVRIDDPFLAPGRHQLNAVVVHSDHFQAQPLVERRAGQEFLDFSQRDFFAHRIDWFLLSRDSAMKNIPIDSASRGDVSLPLPGCEEGSGDGSAATLSLSRSLLTPLHPTASARGRGRATAPSFECALRHDDDLAEDLAILDQAQALGGLFERQDLVDHRLHLAVRDQLHQSLEIVVVEAVRANDLQLKSPHITKVLFWIVASGRTTHEQLATAFEASQRGLPGIAAGEVDDHVDAAVVAAPLRLAVALDRPPGKVDFLIVDHFVGAELLKTPHLVGAAGASYHFGAEVLGEDDA